MDTAKNNFATNLKELRQEHSLSQKDFGASIGISAMAISSYESGTKSPSIDTVCRIAETYHVSIDWLCGTGDIKNHSLEIKTYTDLMQYIHSNYVNFTDAQKEKIILLLNCFTIASNEDVVEKCVRMHFWQVQTRRRGGVCSPVK